MTNQGELADGSEVAVPPVDVERGLALVVRAEATDAESWRMPKG